MVSVPRRDGPCPEALHSGLHRLARFAYLGEPISTVYSQTMLDVTRLRVLVAVVAGIIFSVIAG